jgi:hypothetical protein
MKSQTGHSIPCLNPFAISKLKEIAFKKNTDQMIMSMRDELREIGEGAPESSRIERKSNYLNANYNSPLRAGNEGPE